MSLEKLENHIQELENITHKLALEVHRGVHGPTYEFCQLVLNNLQTPALIIGNTYEIIYLNNCARKYIKEKTDISVRLGKTCYKEVFNLNDVCNGCPVKLAIDNRKVYFVDFISPKTSLKYSVICIPLIYDGVAGAIEIIIPK
jgi:hypothetical protein